MQVGVHQLGHDVDVVEVREGWGGQYVDDLDDVHVVQTAQKPDLPHYPLGVHDVLKGRRNLLDSHLNNAISSTNPQCTEKVRRAKNMQKEEAKKKEEVIVDSRVRLLLASVTGFASHALLPASC